MYTLERDQLIPAPLERVFQFFSDAYNLRKITPGNVYLDVRSVSTPQMQAGTEIRYVLRWHGLRIRWMTRITEWDPPRGFVDEAPVGPYKLWRHSHWFAPEAGGTRMRDRVDYDLHGGPLKSLIFPFVRRDLERIFDFRAESIGKLFLPSP